MQLRDGVHGRDGMSHLKLSLTGERESPKASDSMMENLCQRQRGWSRRSNGHRLRVAFSYGTSCDVDWGVHSFANLRPLISCRMRTPDTSLNAT